MKFNRRHFIVIMTAASAIVMASIYIKASNGRIEGRGLIMQVYAIRDAQSYSSILSVATGPDANYMRAVSVPEGRPLKRLEISHYFASERYYDILSYQKISDDDRVWLERLCVTSHAVAAASRELFASGGIRSDGDRDRLGKIVAVYENVLGERGVVSTKQGNHDLNIYIVNNEGLSSVRNLDAICIKDPYEVVKRTYN